MNENNTREHNDFREGVLAQIREGRVHMRPRAYFIFKMVLLVCVAALFFLTTAFLASYICFFINESHRGALLGFGQKGIRTFVSIFPWRVLVADLFFLVLFEWLFRRFRIAYRRSFAYIFLGSLAVIGAAGLALCNTALHPFLLEQGEHDGLPVIGGMYGHLRHSAPDRGVFRGTIIQIGDGMITIAREDFDSDWDEEECDILLPPGTPAAMIWSVGDEVFVAGEAAPGECTIRAYGIQKITSNMMPRAGEKDGAAVRDDMNSDF